MLIIKVIVKGGVVLNYTILRGVFVLPIYIHEGGRSETSLNIMPLNTTANYNLNNKHVVCTHTQTHTLSQSVHSHLQYELLKL